MVRARMLGMGLAVAIFPGIATAQAPSGPERSVATPAVFQRFGDRVVRIQVVEVPSGTKVSVGSGFFIDTGGRLVTNYHVIAELVHQPDRYRVELSGGATASDTATILAIDVVHDLALLQATRPPRAAFRLTPVSIDQGDRLYSLGHPHDLGLSIVEGTFNGLLQHTLYPRMHFTGSINPGMSGGPTITADGRVVGINVSTAGNQVSFLVPVDRAIALAEGVTGSNGAGGALLATVREQLHGFQEAYLAQLFADSTKRVEMGPFRPVTEPAPFFRCWADIPPRNDQPYEVSVHSCSSDDQVYIARDQQSGIVELTHELVTNKGLISPRYFALYSSVFAHDHTPAGVEEHVTSWRCRTRTLGVQATTMRAVLCLRAYRKLKGLYDGVIKVAQLGRKDAGLVSTLALSGVSFANLDRITTRFLEQAAWR